MLKDRPCRYVMEATGIYHEKQAYHLWNVFDKPNDQRELVHFGMARKRGMKSNVFDKPNDQSELVHFGMARKRGMKSNVFDKPNDQRELVHFGMARTEEQSKSRDKSHFGNVLTA